MAKLGRFSERFERKAFKGGVSAFNLSATSRQARHNSLA